MVDPGLATDRTALAWQRTALATAAGAAIMARLTFDRLGPSALVTMAAALGLSGWILLESRGRYRHDAGLRQRRRPRGGRAPLVLALAVGLIALTELIALTGETVG
jgi:uncharacterized membrane protein YidH (DUF202 family)